MFEPFVSTKDGVGTRSGSGLGLAVVLSIVKDHLGYVDVRRDCDGWPSAFSLYLPLAPVP